MESNPAGQGSLWRRAVVALAVAVCVFYLFVTPGFSSVSFDAYDVVMVFAIFCLLALGTARVGINVATVLTAAVGTAWLLSVLGVDSIRVEPTAPVVLLPIWLGVLAGRFLRSTDRLGAAMGATQQSSVSAP